MNCRSLSAAYFAPTQSISFYTYAFSGCWRLISLYLLGSRVGRLAMSTVFNSTPIGGYSDVAGAYGSIFVPESLYSTYVSSTNWAVFSSRFASLTSAEIAEILGV